MKKRKLLLIFDRDFSQWLNQMLHDCYVYLFPKIWGRGLEDQMVHFTGRSTEIYRYEDDYKKLGQYMIKKKLSFKFFSEAAHKKFRAEVKELRKLIAVNPSAIKNPSKHYHKILDIFISMYPYYTLGVFLPGPWRNDFLKYHGKKAMPIINRVFKSREASEGVAKVCSDFLMAWLGPIYNKKTGNIASLVNLFTVEELTKFVDKGTCPSIKLLEKRIKGYMYIGGKIILIDDFSKFLEQKKLYLENSVIQTSKIAGTVACRGGIIKGVVQTLFNSKEVAKFKPDNILLTPMTSPEYLPAIHKAKAIVTDEGGLSCHAAIVSRELGIPCVIGTKIATKVFKDGDMVEVDATRGIVRKI